MISVDAYMKRRREILERMNITPERVIDDTGFTKSKNSDEKLSVTTKRKLDRTDIGSPESAKKNYR